MGARLTRRTPSMIPFITALASGEIDREASRRQTHGDLGPGLQSYALEPIFGEQRSFVNKPRVDNVFRRKRLPFAVDFLVRC